ncbi:MAG: hypothetical protein COZ31_06345, partial [Nitrospirae bacterium CG_4_10_14_3_um_filter_44_29]
MSQRSYKRLSLQEREEISRSLAQGLSFLNIAGLLDRNVSTISRHVLIPGTPYLNKRGSAKVQKFHRSKSFFHRAIVFASMLNFINFYIPDFFINPVHDSIITDPDSAESAQIIGQRG